MAPPSTLPTNGVLDSLLDSLLEGHEARLIRLEDGVQHCNSSLVETRSDIKYLKESIHSGLNVLGTKVDKVLIGVDDMKPRLTKVEAANRTKLSRHRWIRGTIWGLILTGLGAGIAKLIEKLLER